MKDFMERNKIALLYLTIGIAAICGLQTFLLPYIVNTLMTYSAVKLLEVVIAVALLVCGLVFLLLALFKANREVIEQKKVKSYIGNLLLLMAIVLAAFLVIAIVLGLISRYIYVSTELDYDKAKVLISFISGIVYLCIEPLVFWLFAGVVYEKILLPGIKKATQTLKKGYWRLILLILLTSIIRFFASLTGNQIVGLSFQLVISILVNTGIIVLTLYWFRSFRKVEQYD